MTTTQLQHAELTRKIIGVFYQVFRELRSGFDESVYHTSMHVALTQAGLNVETEVQIAVYFRELVVGRFRADMIVDDQVVVECKAADKIHPAHKSQLVNYLAGTEREVGLVLNFGPVPTFARVFNANTGRPLHVHPDQIWTPTSASAASSPQSRRSLADFS